MTYADIQARIQALVKLGGWSNSSPAPDYAFLANEGLRLFSRETQHNIESTTITLAGNTQTYTLLTADTRDWISLFDDALYNGTTWLSQTTRDQLRRDNHAWRGVPSGTPAWWFWSGPQEIGFYPIPSASATVTFDGARHEPRLVNPTDAPLVDEDFHEGICLFGAWHHGKPYSRGEEREVATGYYREALDYTKRCMEALKSKDASLVVRHVSRAPQEYLALGAKQRPVFYP